jgi:hypothetical protein
MPIWQPTPGGQTLPQAPQFVLSAITFAQKTLLGFAESAHATLGDGQVCVPGAAQVPFTHDCPF